MRLWKRSILLFVSIAAVIIVVFATGIVSVDCIPVLGINSTPVSDFDNVPVLSSHNGSAGNNDEKFNTEETLKLYVDILTKLKDNQELEGLKDALFDIMQLEKLEPENARVLGLKDRLEWQIKIIQAKKDGVYNEKFKTEENEQFYIDILVKLKDNQKPENLEEALYEIIQLEKLESDNFRVLGLKRSLEKRLKYFGVDVPKLKEYFLHFDSEAIPDFDPNSVPDFNPDNIPSFDIDSIPSFDPDSVPDFNPDNIPSFNPDSVPDFKPR